MQDLSISGPSSFSPHDTTISDETQQMLNQPLVHGSMEETDRQFLALIIEKIEKKEILLYQPSSLLNHATYDSLPIEKKESVELDAFNLLSTIREIYRLWQANLKETYQIENLVHKIRLTKERLEAKGGDLYII